MFRPDPSSCQQEGSTLELIVTAGLFLLGLASAGAYASGSSGEAPVECGVRRGDGSLLLDHSVGTCGAIAIGYDGHAAAYQVSGGFVTAVSGPKGMKLRRTLITGQSSSMFRSPELRFGTGEVAHPRWIAIQSGGQGADRSAVQGAVKILVGMELTSGTSRSVVITRFGHHGQLDDGPWPWPISEFGGYGRGGSVRVAPADAEGDDQRLVSMEIDHRNRLVLGIRSCAGEGSERSGLCGFHVVRLTPDGAPDTTFGQDGVARVLAFGEDHIGNLPVRPVVDATGRIMLLLPTGRGLSVYRLLESGELDRDFVSGHERGEIEIIPASGSFHRSCRFDADLAGEGMVVAALCDSRELTLAMLDSKGELSARFGRFGQVTHYLEFGGAEAAPVHPRIARLGDGRLLVAAGAVAPHESGGNGAGLRVVRFVEDGTSLDPEFGEAGSSRIGLFGSSAREIPEVSAIHVFDDGAFFVFARTSGSGAALMFRR